MERPDLARLREICVLTGAAGGDATGRWSSDDLLPDLFLEPYTTYAPGWAFVVELDGEVQGYLVAVSSTPAFISWWRDTWTPWFATVYTRPGEPYSRASPTGPPRARHPRKRAAAAAPRPRLPQRRSSPHAPTACLDFGNPSNPPGNEGQRTQPPLAQQP